MVTVAGRLAYRPINCTNNITDDNGRGQVGLFIFFSLSECNLFGADVSCTDVETGKWPIIILFAVSRLNYPFRVPTSFAVVGKSFLRDLGFIHFQFNLLPNQPSDDDDGRSVAG